LINPTYNKEIKSDNLKLISESEGYKLYEINGNNLPEQIYFDELDGNKIERGEHTVDYTYINTKINTPDISTPIFNLSPTEAGVEGILKIHSNVLFDKIQLEFRTYSKKDYLAVECNVNNVYSFRDIDYLNKPIELDCPSSEITLRMYSSEFKDRTMITSILLKAEN
jgi:hypothetical protein